MKHVLAVDGGNSKTLAVVARSSGRIVGRARGGGSNYQSAGRRAAARVLGEVIGGALAEAGVERVDAACYGLSGADREKDFAVFRELLAPIDKAAKSVLVNDTLLALRAGTDDGVGVALIGGAGSNCIGMNGSGKIRKAMGLGPTTGDKANAGALVEDAIAAAMKGVDGRGPATALEGKLMAALGLDALEDLIEFGFADSRRDFDFGSLAPLVFEAADEGDEAAVRLLRAHGAAAGEAAVAVLAGLFAETDSVPLVLGGSLYQKGSNPALIDSLIHTVIARFPKVRIVKLVGPPVVGGVLRALDEMGVKADAQVRERLRDGIRD